MFSGPNRAEKADSAFGQRSAAESQIWLLEAHFGHFWPLTRLEGLREAELTFWR